MISDEKLSKVGQKKQQSIGIKSFYTNTSYGFEYKKNCISKFSIKVFIKRKTRAGKTCGYRMLLSFKKSVSHAGQLYSL